MIANLVLHQQATARQQAGETAAAITLWRQAIRAYPHAWQTQAALGRQLFADGAHAEAQVHLEQALTLVAQDPSGVAEAERLRTELRGLARTSRSLAGRYVAPPRMRNGRLGGVWITRGIAEEPVDIPILFETASATLTDIDRAHAADLLEFLNDERAREVRLAGHADERGSYDFNCRLSERRAEAVAGFLRENGFTGVIETVGRCTDAPFAASPSRAAHAREALWTMDRRVEIELWR